MSKRETLEEFLARGGEIQRLPPQATPEERKVNPTTGSGGMMSLSEGGLFYAEIKEKVKKAKKTPAINLSALPPSLLKFVKNKANATKNNET